ncbi:DUF2079 domain-containing protein [Leptospira kmetyi]|uniref:DUF2079 domain-containing protein n=1 Tax=Leptospira kmetyi TaxID=408139 RepID=A0AAD0XPR4_9LEPT|nr:DUF2079 domain-containing protein [Leptospira kmetyi]AYV55031.1 DUF2079 domain-containing protein [Leptospira kmetyi]
MRFVSFLFPFFILYLPVQYLFGSKGIGGPILEIVLILCGIVFWYFNSKNSLEKKTFGSFFVSPMVWISYWSLFVFAEGIFYTKNAADSFLLGDLDYTAQLRMILPVADGTFFQTQYYGVDENANFLSHHMAPSILLLSPFPFLFGSKLGFGIGVFFFASSTIPLLFFYLRECSISEDFSLCACLLWAGSSGFYRLNHSLHFEVLVPFLCLCVLIGIQKRKYWILGLGLCFFLGIKEDLSIYLAALAVGAAFADSERRKEWISVFCICIFYYIILVPALGAWAGQSAQRNWKEYWGAGSENPFTTAVNYIQNSESRSQYWKGFRDLSLEWGLGNLTGGWVLFPFFALYSAFRLSIHPWVRDLYSYYVYPLIPFLIYFLKTGTTWIQKRNDKRTILWILLAFFLTVYRNTKENDYPIPLSPESDRAAELEKILEQIPPNVGVSAGFHISPFISLKNSVYPIRETRDWKEWIVLDLRYNSPYLSSEKILQRMESDLRSGKLRWVQRTDRFGLLRRDQPESETKTEIKIRAKTQP